MRLLNYLLAATLVSVSAPAMARTMQAQSHEIEHPLPLLVSTDMGNEVDDQWVVVHLISDPKFDVVGLVSAYAPFENIPGPPATIGAKALRQILERRLGLTDHPPIVAGSDQPLAGERQPRDTAGARAIVEASKGYGPAKRLTVVMTGAATDVASALLLDPTLQKRIRLIAMGFQTWGDGREFNIKNDAAAWRVILASEVPVTVGAADVTRRDLALSGQEASNVLADGGPIETWLLRDYRMWWEAVGRDIPGVQRPDKQPNWVIWDEVTTAYLLGMTHTESKPRFTLDPDLKFVPTGKGPQVEWVTSVDHDALFAAFRASVRSFSRSHAVADQPCVTFGRSPLSCWRRD